MLALLVFALVWSACGGEAFTAGNGGNVPPDGGSAGSATAGAGGGAGSNGSGGSVASGGSSGGAGTTGGGGGSAGQGGRGGGAGAGLDAGAGCPAQLPVSSSPCAPDGLQCLYGKCCPTHASCSGGKWQIAITDCAVPGCPATAPLQGASCTCVNTPVPCHYECATGSKSIDALCVNEVWSTQMSACSTNLCGAAMCAPGEICVKKTSNVATTYGCVNNPCGASALTCACAASLCQAGFVCGTSANVVYCSCPQCV